MRKVRSQVEYNEALERVAKALYAGASLVDSCRDERIDPNSFAGKLVLAGMTLDDLSKQGKRFPLHFKRRFKRSEQDEAVRLHLDGVPWSLIASRLGAYESSLSHWLRWMGYESDDREVAAAFEADQGHNFAASPSEPVVVAGETPIPLVLSPTLSILDSILAKPEVKEEPKPEIAYEADLANFRKMAYEHISRYLSTYFTYIGEEGVAALLYANVGDDMCPRCGGAMRIIVTRDGRDFAGCKNYQPDNKGCPGSTATKLFQGGRLKRTILDTERIEQVMTEADER